MLMDTIFSEQYVQVSWSNQEYVKVIMFLSIYKILIKTTSTVEEEISQRFTTLLQQSF